MANAIGNLYNLGTLGGSSSEARAINDEVIIVGTSTLSDQRAMAFLKLPNQPMQNLNAFLPAGSRCELWD